MLSAVRWVPSPYRVGLSGTKLALQKHELKTTIRETLRRTLRERRRGIAEGQRAIASRASAQLLIESQGSAGLWSQARHIGVYLARDGEYDPQGIIDAARAAGKEVYLPVVTPLEQTPDRSTQTGCEPAPDTQGRMTFRLWCADAALVNGAYGIPIPAADFGKPPQLDLVIVPVVGWAPGGCRLGMGGGFYDRYLASHSPIAIGLAYECQREDRLAMAAEAWDQPLNAVLTERKLHWFSPT